MAKAKSVSKQEPLSNELLNNGETLEPQAPHLDLIKTPKQTKFSDLKKISDGHDNVELEGDADHATLTILGLKVTLQDMEKDLMISIPLSGGIVIKEKFDTANQTLVAILKAIHDQQTNSLKQKLDVEIAKLKKMEDEEGLNCTELPDLDEQAYHKGPGVSNSRLGEIAISYGLFQMGTPDRKAFKFGRAAHCFTLENNRFKRSYAIDTEYTGKSEVSLLLNKIQYNGKALLSPTDMATIQSCHERIYQHRGAVALMKEGVLESAFYYKHESGALLRSKLDGYVENPSDELRALLKELGLTLRDGVDIVFDYKFSESVGNENGEFDQSIYTYGYYRQAAMYSNMYKYVKKKENVFIYINVEKKAPFDVVLYLVDPATIEAGEMDLGELIERYLAWSKEPPKWTGRSESIQLASLPHFALTKLGRKHNGL
jgi:hypothetical protein